MRSILNSRWLNLSLRMIIGAIFIYAGILKFQAPAAFADSIASFKILPNEVISIFVLGLPPFEIILGILLIIGRKLRPAALGILILTGIFGLALAQGILRGLEVDCGCFGNGKPSTFKSWLSLARDIILFFCVFVIYRRELCKAQLPRTTNL